MSGVTAISFDVDDLGERSITTQDLLVADMSVVQFDVRFRLIMVALWNRADRYIFILWFLSSIFFLSSPNLRGRTLDVYHTSTHGMALVRI